MHPPQNMGGFVRFRAKGITCDEMKRTVKLLELGVGVDDVHSRFLVIRLLRVSSTQLYQVGPISVPTLLWLTVLPTSERPIMCASLNQPVPLLYSDFQTDKITYDDIYINAF